MFWEGFKEPPHTGNSWKHGRACSHSGSWGKTRSLPHTLKTSALVLLRGESRGPSLLRRRQRVAQGGG